MRFHPVCGLLFLLPGLIRADELLEQRDKFVIAECREAVRGSAFMFLKMQIDDYQTVMALDAKTRKRLELAAKGAAAKYAEEQMEEDKNVIERQLERCFPPGTVNFVLNSRVINLREFVQSKDESAEDEDSDKSKNLQTTESDIDSIYPRISFRLGQSNCGWSFRREGSSSGYGRQGGVTKLVGTNPWKKTVENLFSVEDRKRLTAFQKARANDAVTAIVLGYLDLHLHLQANQKPKIKAWLKNQIDVDHHSLIWDYHSLFVNTIQSLNVDGLEEILSKSQLEVWQIIRQPN